MLNSLPQPLQVIIALAFLGAGVVLAQRVTSAVTRKVL